MHGFGSYRSPDGSEYRGEFKNGLMQGQGERFWLCGRTYRGGWQKDMMWGEGELVMPSGEVYRGQFRANVFHGRGERRWPNGDCYVGRFAAGEQEGDGRFTEAATGECFVGQWLHGRMYGEGRVEKPDGTSYMGEWVDNIPEGRGRQTWPDGSFYEGPFRRNSAEGRGRKVFADGAVFEGQFVDGNFEGHGTFSLTDGTNFEGLWHGSKIAGPGCSRLPDGTVISGSFKDTGACGEGTKSWSCGCVYTGMLLRNRIDKHGTLKWPDGRCYIGEFREDRLHGQGTLVWTDQGGVCTYRGQFQNNAFQGEGKLSWSSGARYEGAFSDGLYHGEGSFRWPQRRGFYRGSWVKGEMSGKGTLECTIDTGDSVCYAYVGQFKQGHMEGGGSVTFHHQGDGTIDTYQGDFRASRFSGRGTFTWGAGAQLEGLFEDGYCNRVGRKVYPDGSVYTGELRYDLEHGKGVMSEPGGRNYVAIWRDGEAVKELLDSCAPEFDLVETTHNSAAPARPRASKGDLPRISSSLTEDPFEDVREKGEMGVAQFESGLEDEGDDMPMGASMSVAPSVSVSSMFMRQNTKGGQRKPLLPIMDENSALVEGKALVVFLNGDRYLGHMVGGRKHGRGMYVYADLVTYRGFWDEDVLDDVRHPVNEDCMPIEVRRLGPSTASTAGHQEQKAGAGAATLGLRALQPRSAHGGAPGGAPGGAAEAESPRRRLQRDRASTDTSPAAHEETDQSSEQDFEAFSPRCPKDSSDDRARVFAEDIHEIHSPKHHTPARSRTSFFGGSNSDPPHASKLVRRMDTTS